MKAQSTGPILTAVFVDYDNIYLSLKRKSEDAAKRFAKDAALWLKELESGRLLTLNQAGAAPVERRIVLNRCYGNPVPRRNAADNSTDMNSFPFVRHHFLRAGFEVIDCPPLTAQLKNSADIRMVMDVRDMLSHETRFEEFILLSGDADFTPLLHRLRAHARRTVVFANDHTAAPYTAISDGEVREADLVGLLMEGRLTSDAEPNAPALASAQPTQADLEVMRRDIVAEVVNSVRAAGQPLPLEALADRAVRLLGHDKTAGVQWGGAGTFRDLLVKALPADIRLSDQPPYFVFDTSRQIAAPTPVAAPPQQRIETPPQPKRAETRYEPSREPRLDTRQAPAAYPAAPAPLSDELPMPPQIQPAFGAGAPPQRPAAPLQPPAPPAASIPPYAPAPMAPQASAPVPPSRPAAPAPQQPAAQARTPDARSAIQQSIARIHDACQAPPLAPPEYRALFEVMADEINANNLAGSQTLINIVQRARDIGVEIRRDDVRFVLEVVSEPDPWFEQGASANLFASRFRNFVVARCRGQGLSLSSDELDLIDAWFGGSPAAQRAAAQAPSAAPQAPATQQGYAPQHQPAAAPQGHAALASDRWWSLDEGRQHVAENRAGYAAAPAEEEFPRIIRSRVRG